MVVGQTYFVSLDLDVKIGSTIFWYLIHKSFLLQRHPLKRIHWPYICISICQFKRLHLAYSRWNEDQNTMLKKKGVSEKGINSVIKYSHSNAPGGDELRDPTLMQYVYCY